MKKYCDKLDKILRKIKEWPLICKFAIVILVIILFINFFGFGLGKKSNNENANKYVTSSCVAFYPTNSDGKKYAKEMCNGVNDKEVFDYTLEEKGDYTKVSYDNSHFYYFNTTTLKGVEINEFSDEAKMVISDYLRYSMKKDEIDEAYTLKYLEDTYYKDLDLTDVTSSINWSNLEMYFPNYDYTIEIPLSEIGQFMDVNLGEDNREYQRISYVSPNRKMLCFTFDDGPSLITSHSIIDELYKYDSSATFFVIGNKLGEKQLEVIKDGIAKGMEYGSHTYDHVNLKKTDYETGSWQIEEPAKIVYENLGYEMHLYRPPYGNRTDKTDSYTDMTAILWNVDSEDWSTRLGKSYEEAVEEIVAGVKEYAKENKLVLFHDIYDTSVGAASELIEYYIDQGYQIVNVSELMNHLGVNDVTRFYGGK